jgi:DNA repair protein RecN (Recombination protein N)
MLTELRVSNFAVVEQLNLQFAEGLTVLTGETGAGKSILIDAIGLLIGGRASADQIRAGAEEAHIEAAFRLDPTCPVLKMFRDAGVLGSQETELIVRRILSRSGRNRAYLNGGLTPLHLLESLAGTVIDIHGQHDQQSLLSAQAQLDMLDAFGRLGGLRDEYTAVYERWLANRRKLEDADRLSAERAQREDFLRFQSREIEEAAIQPGEEERVQAERRRLVHARRLAELTQTAYELLYAGDQSVLNHLSTVEKCLRQLHEIDHETAAWAAACGQTALQLRDLAASLREYRDRLEQDPDQLERIEERLDRLQRLKKKYGGSVEGVLAYAAQLRRQLEELGDSQVRVAELRASIEEDVRRLDALASQLSKGRAKAAKRMQERVSEELAALRMDQTRFEIQVRIGAGDEAFSPTGRDRIDYLLSANRGEPLQPLTRVASGGELSRVMLAIKTVLAETDRVPVLIFDEIDSGIGGAAAAVMGQRLRALGAYHQVLCVTHLPQVASQAEHHLLVEKSVKQNRTITSVKKLDQHARRDEVARMLGGLTITKKVRETAAEMIDSVKEKR